MISLLALCILPACATAMFIAPQMGSQMGGMQMGPRLASPMGSMPMSNMMMYDMDRPDMPDQKIYRKNPYGGVTAYDVNYERSWMPNGQPGVVMEISDPDYGYGMMGMPGMGGNMMMGGAMGGQMGRGQMGGMTLGRQQNGGRGGMALSGMGSANMVQQPQQLNSAQGMRMPRGTSRPVVVRQQVRQQTIQAPAQQQAVSGVRYVTSQSSYSSSPRLQKTVMMG